MALPEEEKAVLTDSILNLVGGLSMMYQRIAETNRKVMDLYTFVDKQQRLPAPSHLKQQLDDIRYDLQSLEDTRVFLRDYTQKARGVVETIQKGVFD